MMKINKRIAKTIAAIRAAKSGSAVVLPPLYSHKIPKDFCNYYEHWNELFTFAVAELFHQIQYHSYLTITNFFFIFKYIYLLFFHNNTSNVRTGRSWRSSIRLNSISCKCNQKKIKSKRKWVDLRSSVARDEGLRRQIRIGWFGCRRSLCQSCIPCWNRQCRTYIFKIICISFCKDNEWWN